METKRNWKAWLTIALAAIAVLQVLPSLMPMPEFYTAIFDRQINLGLDLKGGLELKYTVDFKRAIADNTRKLKEALRERLVDAAAKKGGKDGAAMAAADRDALAKRFTITQTAYNGLEVAFQDAADAALLDKELMLSLDSRFELRAADGNVSLFLPDSAIVALKAEIVDQTLAVVRKRVDAFGLVEPDVRRSGDADIDVQLPGLNERQMKLVREKIGQAAQLSFRMVVPEAKVFADKRAAVDAYKGENAEQAKTLEWGQDGRGGYLKSEKKSEILGFLKTVTLPDNVMIGYEHVVEKEPDSGQVRATYWRTYDLQAVAPLTGDNLTRAAVSYGDKGEPVVNLEFDARGAKIFADVSGANVGNLMAIMLDGDVSSAPSIREQISGGRAQITLGGGRSPAQQMEEARALVTVLNNGAYKAPVIKVHDVEVGPSLGRDAVNSGLLSIILGFVLAAVSMAWYYRQGGLIANVGLAFNMVLILAALVAFNAALTLPGMAGIVLTVGMALDANILIFERIREEIRNGRSVRNALDLGYDKAFWSIFDSQITTAIGGFVLMQFSSGPVYGFAVTLLIGIGCSMFTSITVTRMIYAYLVDSGKITNEISI